MNRRSRNADTALMLASRYGYDRCVKSLIEAGADVNSSYRHMTALTEAVDQLCFKCVEYLIKAGADVNIIDPKGFSILMKCLYYEVKYFKLLLDAGAQVNIITNEGKTALDIFCYKFPENIATKDIFPEIKDILNLLIAAGENFDHLKWMISKFEMDVVPETQINLKHICREAIRKHLLSLDPHTHLFGRVPRLGLPTLLQSYLLYEQTLDQDDDTDGSDDDSGDTDNDDEEEDEEEDEA